jgi:catechol 2,3-dioxygenase-like lactoylglutathione lyase family enzyme
MPDPLPLQAIHHIGRVTRRLEASRAFYRDVLGFREIERPPFGFPGVWLFGYGVQIHLIVNEPLARDPGDQIHTRADHLALHTADVAATEAALAAHGIAYRTNTVPATGVRQLFFHDPDGHHIEVGTYPATPPYV